MRAAPALLFLGCTDKGDGGDSADAVACVGGTPPVIEAMWCENTGMQYYAEGDTPGDVPTLTLWADFADEDGDLNNYITAITYDRESDEAIAADAGAFSPSHHTFDAADCRVPSLELGTLIYLLGGEPFYATTYEWSLTVTDDAELASEPGFVTCTTPAFDGSGDVSSGGSPAESRMTHPQNGPMKEEPDTPVSGSVAGEMAARAARRAPP